MKYYKHSIIWGNPYTNPPQNLPRRLVEVSSHNHRLEGRLKDKFDAVLNKLEKLGIYGFYIGFNAIDDTPRRQWSDEAKKRNRRNRLIKRLQKKYSIPMLLEMAYQEAIAKKPEYYN